MSEQDPTQSTPAPGEATEAVAATPDQVTPTSEQATTAPVAPVAPLAAPAAPAAPASEPVTFPVDSQAAYPQPGYGAYPQTGYTYQQPGYAPGYAPGYPQGYAPGYPPPYAAGGYGYPAPPANNGLAVASLVLGIAGLIIIPIIGSIAGIVTGHIARKQIRERGEGGDGMAVGGLVTGYAGAALWIGILAFAIGLPLLVFASAASAT